MYTAGAVRPLASPLTLPLHAHATVTHGAPCCPHALVQCGTRAINALIALCFKRNSLASPWLARRPAALGTYWRSAGPGRGASTPRRALQPGTQHAQTPCRPASLDRSCQQLPRCLRQLSSPGLLPACHTPYDAPYVPCHETKWQRQCTSSTPPALPPWRAGAPIRSGVDEAHHHSCDVVHHALLLGQPALVRLVHQLRTPSGQATGRARAPQRCATAGRPIPMCVWLGLPM